MELYIWVFEKSQPTQKRSWKMKKRVQSWVKVKPRHKKRLLDCFVISFIDIKRINFKLFINKSIILVNLYCIWSFTIICYQLLSLFWVYFSPLLIDCYLLLWPWLIYWLLLHNLITISLLLLFLLFILFLILFKHIVVKSIFRHVFLFLYQLI